jgi:hypothetical protein
MRFTTASELLAWLSPPGIDVNEILAADARAEAEYLAARQARLAPMARALGLDPAHCASRRGREALREDAAQVCAVRWCQAAGARGAFKTVLRNHVLKGEGPGGWVPAVPIHWHTARARPEEGQES